MLVNADSTPCTYASGANCDTPSTPLACFSISPLGATPLLKQSVCNSYNISGKCGYAAGGSCKIADCADVDPTGANLTYCPAYLSTCVYDGQNCVT